MSKKTAIILSVICFIILVVLIIFEKKFPEAGSELFSAFDSMKNV